MWENPISHADRLGLCGCGDNPNGPGWVASAGFGFPIYGFPAYIGISVTGGGDVYLDPGVGTPGPSVSVVNVPSMTGYAGGPSYQGGYNGAQFGNTTPFGNEPSSGIGNPGASASFGLHLRNLCDTPADATDNEGALD